MTFHFNRGSDDDPSGTRRSDRAAATRAALEERQGALREDRDRWYRLAMAMSLIAATAIGFGIWAAVRSEYVPYIVAVDDLERIQPIHAPKRVANWPDAAVRRELTDIVRHWRAITSDDIVLRQRYRRLQYFLEENSSADRKIREWARNTEPLKLAATTTVEVASVNFVGGRTWLVEWTETRRARATGQVESTSHWRGSFVLSQRRITDPAWLTHNPSGMIVDVRKLDA